MVKLAIAIQDACFMVLCLMLRKFGSGDREDWLGPGIARARRTRVISSPPSIGTRGGRGLQVRYEIHDGFASIREHAKKEFRTSLPHGPKWRPGCFEVVTRPCGRMHFLGELPVK